MKKIFSLITVLCMCVLLIGCNGNSKSNSTENKQTNATVSVEESENIDIDLSSLTSVLAYSQVYTITSEPEKYIGQTVKMKGKFASYDSGTKMYYACMFDDSTACCSLNIEFSPLDKYKYPNDFPDEGEEITVQGIFGTYEEDGITYCELSNATIISK